MRDLLDPGLGPHAARHDLVRGLRRQDEKLLLDQLVGIAEGALLAAVVLEDGAGLGAADPGGAADMPEHMLVDLRNRGVALAVFQLHPFHGVPQRPLHPVFRMLWLDGFTLRQLVDQLAEAAKGFREIRRCRCPGLCFRSGVEIAETLQGGSHRLPGRNGLLGHGLTFAKIFLFVLCES